MKKFMIDGETYLEKEVKHQSDTAGQIYLPASWIGKKGGSNPAADNYLKLHGILHSFYQSIRECIPEIQF